MSARATKLPEVATESCQRMCCINMFREQQQQQRVLKHGKEANDGASKDEMWRSKGNSGRESNRWLGFREVR